MSDSSSHQIERLLASAPKEHQPIRIFVISYEFIFSPFSGNGILARSLINSFLENGAAEVIVWCARPSSDASFSNNDEEDTVYPNGKNRLKVFSTPVDKSKWRKLDDSSAWDEFSFTEKKMPDLHAFLESHQEKMIPIAIDWHGAHAFSTLPFSHVFSPLIYMNFRVYSAGIQDTTRHAWLDSMEQKALQQPDKIIALSDHDKSLLETLMENSSMKQKSIHVFFPPLRKEVHALAINSNCSNMMPSALPKDKTFITCVVRLSPEKETLRFIYFLEHMKDIIEANGWIPVLVGSPSDQKYAAQVRTRLKQVYPSAIDLVDTFLSPPELCAIFQNTALNFHPCSYDAYGMTIVEAAAMSVPSIIASGGTVGASHLVKQDGCISIDMPSIKADTPTFLPQSSINQLQSVLKDDTILRTIGEVARERALEWSESVYGRALLDLAAR